MPVTLRVYRVKAKLSHESLLGGYTDGSDGLPAVTGLFFESTGKGHPMSVLFVLKLYFFIVF